MSIREKKTPAVEAHGTPSPSVASAPLGAAVDDDLDYTPEEERRVLRKIDRIVMSAMTFVYFFQYLDKQTINYASVFGLNTDLRLRGNDFSWIVTLFYFGQLASEFPSGYLMSRFLVTRVVGICTIFWGLCEMCMGATHSFAGVAAVRFCLGLCEGAASPAWVLITSNCIWSSMSGVAQIVGAVLMYLIGQAPPMALANWRVMFLVCGAATVLAGAVFVACVPADGAQAWFLSPRERRIAVLRLARERATRDRSRFDARQLREALREPRTWLLCGMALFICIPSPILKFSSLVVAGFGFDKFRTMLVGLPSGALQILTVFAAALGMRHTRSRRWAWGLLATSVPLVGSVLLLALPRTASWGIVVSTWLAAQSSDLIVISLSLIASNVQGNTKKSIVNAAYFVFYSVGCIVGPQLWQAADAPRYRKGCISSIVSYILLCFCFVGYYLLCRRENRRRDRLGDAAPDTAAPADPDADQTDVQDLRFRYTL